MPTTPTPSAPSHPARRLRRRGPAAAALALSAVLLLGACGDSDNDAKAVSDPTDQVDPGSDGGDGGNAGDLGDLGDELGSTAPEECRDRFPLELEPASLDELTLLPDGWPEGPEGSTLCSVQATMDGGTETAAYVTDLTPEEVIDHYAGLLGPEFDAVEQEGAFGGPALMGTLGDLGWQVDTRTDGTFQLGFGGS